MKKIIFVGQAMPRSKRDPHDWPSLNKWLFSIGLTDDLLKKHTKYSALVDYFPGSVNGSHIVPSKKDIAKEMSRLKKTINDFSPDVVVPIGRLSISYCLSQKVQPLIYTIGNSYMVNPYGLYEREVLAIPLPHPSGASTWRHKEENKKLLKKALSLLKNHI